MSLHHLARGNAAEAMRTSTSSLSAPDSNPSTTGLSVGAIAGIAVAGAVLLFIGLAPLLVWLARLQDRRHARRDEANHQQHLQLQLDTDGRNGGVGIGDGRPKTSAGPGPDVGGGKVGYTASAKHFEAGESSESDACLDRGDGMKGMNVSEKQIRRKTLKKKGGSTSSREIFDMDKIEEGEQRTSAAGAGVGDASVVTPFLARPYNHEIQYSQRPAYKDTPEQQYHGGRMSEHGRQRTCADEDDNETLMDLKKRTSGMTLVNFAANSTTVVASNTETNDEVLSPTSTTTNRSMIRSWFPQTLGKTLSRKLSFGNRHVEEIIGNPRLLNNANRTSGQNASKNANVEGDAREEISVHNTPRSTPVIVHHEGEDYLHSWQAGGDSGNRHSNGHPANAAPVIPRAPSSVIHNPRQRTAMAAAADALHKQKMAIQQQQQQQMQMQKHQKQQQMHQQQQLLLLHHQQQQMHFMNMQMKMNASGGNNASSPQVSPPKRPPRFRQSATDSELTEILRMTAERLEDNGRHERRHHVLNPSNGGDIPNIDIDENAEQRRSRSPTKSIKTSARETMLSSDTTGDNINLIVPPVIHSNSQIQSPDGHVGSACNSQMSQQQNPNRSPARQGTPPHQQHRRRVSHVSFASMISEPDSLVAGDTLARPPSQIGLTGHQTPLSSPSRKQSFVSPDELLQQAAHVSQMSQQALQQSPQRQPVGAVGGSHRPFSPASTESSALSTLYSESEPNSGAGTPGSGITGSRRQPQRNSLNNRNSTSGAAPILPAGLYRTESQRTALAEILRRSRDFDAESNSLAPSSLALGSPEHSNSKITAAMSPAPLRLRNSIFGSGSEGGETNTNDDSPSTRDFEMVTSNGISNDGNQRVSAATVGTDASGDLVTAMSPTAEGEDPFVSATPQHNARLSQLFSPLPKEGPRPTAMNAANAAIKSRYPSGSSPVSGGRSASGGGIDRSSMMGGGGTIQLSTGAGADSPSKRLTMYLTKATPEADTPCPSVHSRSVIHTPQRESTKIDNGNNYNFSSSSLDLEEGSPTLRAIDLAMSYDESPAAVSETRLSSLYDSYNYSTSASASTSDLKSASSTTLATTANTASTTTLAGHANIESANTSRFPPIDNKNNHDHYRPESFHAVASAKLEADGSSIRTGTDSDPTIEQIGENVLVPSRTADNYHHFRHNRLPSDERPASQRFSRSLFNHVANQPRLTYDLLETDETAADPTPSIPEKHSSREKGTLIHHITMKKPIDGTDFHHDEAYKNNKNNNTAAAADYYGQQEYNDDGDGDGGGDAVGRLSASESNIRSLNSMRVTQAIVELRRMNSQMSTTSGHSALTNDGSGSTYSTGGNSNYSGNSSTNEGTVKGGVNGDNDSPTLPQLRGGGFSPSKRSSSILGRRNYLSLGGNSMESGASNRGSYASVSTSAAAAASSIVLSDGVGDDVGFGAGMTSDGGAESVRGSRGMGVPRRGGQVRHGKPSAERRAAWRRTVADPTGGGEKGGKLWSVDEKVDGGASATDGFLSSRKSLHESMARSGGGDGGGGGGL